MTTTENPSAISEVLHAALNDPDALTAVPVDTGNLLIVDPCHIDAGMLAAITQPNEHGVTVGVVVSTPAGDGWIGLYNEGHGGLRLQAPFWGPHDDWAVAPDETLHILTGGLTFSERIGFAQYMVDHITERAMRGDLDADLKREYTRQVEQSEVIIARLLAKARTAKALLREEQSEALTHLLAEVRTAKALLAEEAPTTD